MMKVWLRPFVLLLAGLSAVAARPAIAAETAAPSGTALPSYSREDVMKVCLSEYGMGNSSIIDCLAEDQKIRVAVARRWPDVDERIRKSCLTRLSDLHITSYAHLDSCLRAPDQDAAGSD